MNEKSKNQYYGKAFEYLICQFHNNEKINNPYPDEIKEKDFQGLCDQAKKFLQLIPSYEEPFLWTGNHTHDANCDIMMGARKVEIKHLSNGKGTYLNTSLENIVKYGFVSYYSYMEKYGLYDVLNSFLGNVSHNGSPLSVEEAKNFMKTHPKEYKVIQQKEKEIRQQYVADLYQYFLDNPQKLACFLQDCLSKNISDKETPDIIFVYNYKKNTIFSFEREEICNRVESQEFKNAGLSFVFSKIRIAFGWQNGAGLNNPTIRVFLK